MNMKKHSLRNKKYIIISIVLIICLWQLVAIIYNNRVLLPSFFNVLESVIRIIIDKNFFKIIVGSIGRYAISFIISFSIAIILGIISYYNKFIYNFLYPINLIIKSVPTMAVVVLLLIWSPKGYVPIIIGIIISFPIFYGVVINSLINIDINLIRLCKVYRVRRIDKLLGVVLPSIYIDLNSIVASTSSLIFKVVISGEVYAQPSYGIGSTIQIEKMNLNTNYIIAWMFIIVGIVYIFELTLEYVVKKYGGGKYVNI